MDVRLLDFDVQIQLDGEGKPKEEVLAYIVTCSEHVICYTISTKTFEAGELWRMPVVLYGPIAEPEVTKLNRPRAHTPSKFHTHTWPATIALNKKYLLVS